MVSIFSRFSHNFLENNYKINIFSPKLWTFFLVELENTDDLVCEDYNECENTNQNTCHRTEDCTDTIGSYICACKDGYKVKILLFKQNLFNR